MAFFHELLAELEHERERSRSGHYSALRRKLAAITRQIDVPEEVLRFAPKKTRLQLQPAEDQVEQLETEIRRWQERAGRAETRLRLIEESIQQIAARCARSLPGK